MSRRRGRGWQVARQALTEAFGEVGWVKAAGVGLSRAAWKVEVGPDTWVALVPGDRDAAERARREARLLAWLQGRTDRIRVPRVHGPVGEVLIREWLWGAPVDPKHPFTAPAWETIGRAAAAVHAIEPPEFLEGFATRRGHAVSVAAELEALDAPLALEAAAWVRAHVPPGEPGALLHGDLLGQNVLEHVELPPGVIDWEYASRGDPALDLAIVTRGARRPFGEADGLERLLEAYERAGGRGVKAEHVRIHELGMLAGWVVDEREERRPGDAEDRFRGLAQRVLRVKGPG